MTDYRGLRQKHKTVKFETKNDLKNGIWVPVSVASLLSDYSTQRLRLLGFKGSIETGRFKVGPLLVNLDSLNRLKSK